MSLIDLDNMSLPTIPRKHIIAYGQLAQENLMYYLFVSYYTSVSWGQRLIYKGLQVFIDKETQQKLVLSGDPAPEALVRMFHPDQLEERFGGRRPTPTQFWPPYVGEVCRTEEFLPENLISPEEYENILRDNPELHVHPL